MNKKHSKSTRKAIQEALEAAQSTTPSTSKTHRTIPTHEGHWCRAGQLVRIKLIDLEPAMPEGLDPTEIQEWTLLRPSDGKWQRLPVHLDYSDAYGRWLGRDHVTADALIDFPAPETSAKVNALPPEAAKADCCIPLSLWDSRDRARCEGLFLCGSRRPARQRGTGVTPSGGLTGEPTDTGFRVSCAGEPLLHFDRSHGYQLDFAAVPGTGQNLIDPGRTWRWLPTETRAELTGDAEDVVQFEPVVSQGIVLVIRVAAQTRAGEMQSTLRIFRNGGALVLEFSDYRTVRRRPELPPEEYPRSYAGQMASPYPGIHYAALVVDSVSPARVHDHLYKFGPVQSDAPLALVYTGSKDHAGYNWMALETPAGYAGITVHGRSHHPDHPFKTGTEAGRVTLALEPFGSVVGDRYQSCDRYMLVLAPTVEEVREAFESLDTYPILAKVPVCRSLAFLDTYECLARWVNLNLDHLMKPGGYRNAMLTDGRVKDDTDTCVVAIGELIRLYEKTGSSLFLDRAGTAAEFVADWILSDRFHTRGEGLNPNHGGIYQSEQIYLLLSLARVYRHTRGPRLLEAIRHGVDWLYQHRGGLNTWGWADYLWHAGGFDASGKPIYYWPVNSNQFATLNFRLYELLGEPAFYEQAMTIMEDYKAHLSADTRELIRGGGVSDTTRGVHLFAEAITVAGKDPRIDTACWKRVIEETQDRFWVEGWIQIRNSIYGELIAPGSTPGEMFSPGFHHWHNVGSFLDILPRIQVAAEAGVSEHLTRWAVRDLAGDFDVRYGMEEHTHFSRYAIRDTDIEPASWLDPELLPTLKAVRSRGWIDADDFALLYYKIHRMVQRTFIALDAEHGGWAGMYDAHGGEPIKYLGFWEQRHSHERFAPDEPREIWGIAPREAYHDHSTHYWSHLEQLVDDLLQAETASVEKGVQTLTCREPEAGRQTLWPCPVLVPKAPGAKRVKVATAPGQRGWRVVETRSVRIGKEEFWLLAVEEKDEG